MDQDLQHLYQLFASSDSNNQQLALQLLKGQRHLKEKVTAHYQAILEASKKKTIRSVPKILQELKVGKGTIQARLQLGTVPEIHKDIKELFLNSADIDTLPEWIQLLPNLELLALRSCKLKALPDWIGNLSQLNFLSVADNQIKKLPDSIGQLKNLSILYLSNNQIKTLPASMANLTRLRFLYVGRNPMSSPKKVEQLYDLLPYTHIMSQ